MNVANAMSSTISTPNGFPSRSQSCSWKYHKSHNSSNDQAAAMNTNFMPENAPSLAKSVILIWW
jgi:hypothetical protein